MQLVSLQVHKDLEVIRHLKFNEGLSIVTNSEDDGNQIGKSTALRVINFCLGSDGKSIWHDPESKVSNVDIEELVTSGRVTFTLNIKVNGKNYCIKRRIFKLHQKNRVINKIISYIDDQDYPTNDSFKSALAPLLGFSLKNPTYSAIKNRLVRLDKNTASNIYRYLNSNTSDRQYVVYYSYIFGFSGHDDLVAEMAKQDERSRRESRVDMLLNGNTEQDIKDKIESIDDDIFALKQKEMEFDFKDAQNKGVEKLNAIRGKIASLTESITKLNIRTSYNDKTIESYQSQNTKVDLKLVEKIYSEAKTLSPNINKSLEDLIYFHESLISRKVDYLIEKKNEYKIELNFLTKNINDALDKEKTLISSLINDSHLSGFIIIENELRDKYEERGRIAVILDEVISENNKISELKEDIRKLRAKNKRHIEQLKTNVRKFNKKFRSLSREVFKDFALSVNVDNKSDTNEIEFSIVNQKKVSGDGAPRAASLAFDMSLVVYSKESSSNLPQCTLQDYLEAADQDKLAILARKSVSEKIQVVMSVLKDKLISLDEDFIEKHTILRLDKNNKFFGI
ncbi:hypothetical protein [Photobacterium profundum]|uniref:hypothetical protein n=1 Tax=Photobacterium profundum TaxID=74109 RepID=UPI003D0D9D66